MLKPVLSIILMLAFTNSFAKDVVSCSADLPTSFSIDSNGQGTLSDEGERYDEETNEYVYYNNEFKYTCQKVFDKEVYYDCRNNDSSDVINPVVKVETSKYEGGIVFNIYNKSGDVHTNGPFCKFFN